MKLEMYMKDDAIVKIGQTGRSMYFISKGSVLVEMPDIADSKPFGKVIFLFLKLWFSFQF